MDSKASRVFAAKGVARQAIFEMGDFSTVEKTSAIMAALHCAESESRKGRAVMTRKRRLVSIAHSYCVALNRRLAHEMAVAGAGRWEVTAVAPSFFQGDLRPVALEMSEDERCRVEAVPAHFSKRIHFMLYGNRLREALRENWDLIHCWEEPYILAGGQVAMWSSKQAALVYATFQNIEKRYPPPFSQIERHAMRRAAGWIAFGQTIKQTLAKRPCYSRRPSRVIPLGVDLDKFHPDPNARQATRQELGWGEQRGEVVVGYLGRFVEQKGLRIMTRALDQTPARWRALFVGGGPLEASLREWALPYGDRVKIATGVKHGDVPRYLNAMDMLCAPSQTTPAWREQLGRMLIEAFACGVPVIASDSGEIPHVITGAGLIVNEKDESEWARAIAALIEDAPRRAEMSKQGIDRARTEYSWPVIAKQHLSFFDELLESRTQ
jgi:glycosyltransferase involved in cell wall biosynthesis